jgi:uroporphyrinogen-III synthase
VQRENRLVPESPLQGTTIGVTAERRAAQQAELLNKRGAAVLHGPTLRVFSLDDDQVLRSRTAEVIAQPPDFLLASTGFGMRTWLAAADSWGLRDALLAALRPVRVANRGAKAASANQAVGLTEWGRAPHERLDELVKRVFGRNPDRPPSGAPAPRGR